MDIDYIIVHHSAVSRTKNSEQFDAINRYHISKGWGMIGYHYLIEPDGEIKIGRAEGQTGAHCIGRNHDSIGICLTGNFDIESPTIEQENSLRTLLLALCEKYSVMIKYHRDFANKSCPGNLIADDWARDLIYGNKKSVMKLVIDNNNDQYLVEETSKFGVSIADPELLNEIIGHFAKLGIALETPSLTTDMTPYFIIHGATAKRIKEFFNI